MSSETSTDSQFSGDYPPQRSDSLQPWQLFTLAGLIGATITVFLSRGQSPAAVILLSLTVFAAAAVGIAALRTVMPLTSKARPDSTQVLGGRTRAVLERDKALVLRSIKELEFDRAMGKVSEKDFTEMSGRLRARATRLMRQLDAGAGYREQIEREIEKRLGKAPTVPVSAGSTNRLRAEGASASLAEARVNSGRAEAEQDPAHAVCTQCQTSNDLDARFCKGCGKALEARS